MIPEELKQFSNEMDSLEKNMENQAKNANNNTENNNGSGDTEFAEFQRLFETMMKNPPPGGEAGGMPTQEELENCNIM